MKRTISATLMGRLMVKYIESPPGDYRNRLRKILDRFKSKEI